MLRQITVFPTIASRSAEGANLTPSERRVAGAERPETELEELLRRWIAAGLPRGLGMVGLWMRRLRDRRELHKLTAAQLRDVGLDPGFVRRESEKPFWLG